MKNLNFLFIIILFSFPLCETFSQSVKRGNELNPINHLFFSEVYQTPNGSSNDLYYIFKIPNDRLVFEKNEIQYEASYHFTVEVLDSNRNFVVRQTKEENVFVKYFGETTSKDLYSSGFLKFEIPKGSYNLIPIVIDKNSDQERRLPETSVQLKDLNENNFLEPIIVYQTKTKCGNSEKYYIPNFNGDVPFDIKSYDLIIPSPDSTLQNIFVTLINNKDTTLRKEISESFIGKTGLGKCGEQIVLGNDNSQSRMKYFVLHAFNRNLKEGKLSILISKENNSDKQERFVKAVNWFNMPFSLRNPEFAIESLKYIEDEKKIDSLLDGDEKDYRKNLFDYWKKYDPTPETSFNELMNEYYSRIDYAAKNFNSISGKSGFSSDRGKIFIKFGKPNKIERNSTELGRVVETWIYEKPERKFIFVDERGTGDYQLKNG